MTDVDTMSIDELRIAVAREVMGWSEVSSRRSADGTPTGVITTTDGRQIVDDIPDYPRDIAEAQQITTAIKERGLMPQFIDALIVQVLGRDMLVRHEMRGLDSEEVAALVLASPEQICRAALRTIRSAR